MLHRGCWVCKSLTVLLHKKCQHECRMRRLTCTSWHCNTMISMRVSKWFRETFGEKNKDFTDQATRSFDSSLRMRPPNIAALPHIQKSSLAHQGRRMMNTTMTLLPR